MKKIEEAFRKMMYGRYGVDHLGRDMMWVSLGLLIISSVTHIKIFWYIAILGLLILYWRMFSKQTMKRYEENRKYMNWRTPLMRKLNKFLKRIKDMPKYKYLHCPKCNTQMRVPRGKKNIVVTCPSCRHKFDAKS